MIIKLFFAVNSYLKAIRTKKYTSMKPVSTIKQAREEIAKLLEETENGNLDCFQSFQNSLIKIIKTYYFGLTCKLTGEADLRVLFFGDKKGNEFTPGEDQDKSKKRITIEFEKDPGKDELDKQEGIIKGILDFQGKTWGGGKYNLQFGSLPTLLIENQTTQLLSHKRLPIFNNMNQQYILELETKNKELEAQVANFQKEQSASITAFKEKEKEIKDLNFSLNNLNIEHENSKKKQQELEQKNKEILKELKKAKELVKGKDEVIANYVNETQEIQHTKEKNDILSKELNKVKERAKELVIQNKKNRILEEKLAEKENNYFDYSDQDLHNPKLNPYVGKAKELQEQILDLQEELRETKERIPKTPIFPLNNQFKGDLEERVWHHHKLRIITNYELSIATLLEIKDLEGLFLETESNVQVLKYTPAEEVMEELYPDTDENKTITSLNLTQKGLRGVLDLEDFESLEELTINLDYLSKLATLTDLEELGLENIKNLAEVEAKGTIYERSLKSFNGDVKA
ncbi:11504_t:CDS:10 [Entrophospora sp. SA101]|nr:11504_t:CDS:10 [Entrophospora sp. SA101]